ncbi:hypothetical protein GGR50DRAFT_636330 [Xylaria sp. CBS 124048]|nr:hypothetical protein GGR50DRAFT_636330 [Xylaria sp. CBS 124048]
MSTCVLHVSTIISGLYYYHSPGIYLISFWGGRRNVLYTALQIVIQGLIWPGCIHSTQKETHSRLSGGVIAVLLLFCLKSYVARIPKIRSALCFKEIRGLTRGEKAPRNVGLGLETRLP